MTKAAVMTTHAYDWDTIDNDKYADENASIADLIARQPLDANMQRQVREKAIELVKDARASSTKGGVVESFLKEFSLGTREGIALMCLAEALLRTPDANTRDRLIAEKIGSADWASHMGQSDSLFVNASTWGLMLTGKLVDVENDAKADASSYLKRLVARVGEPVIRQAVGAAVRMMGEQFVLGKNIPEALKRSARENYLCSFDMLGEGARTAEDAARYEAIYAQAIEAVGLTGSGAGPEIGHGVSVKLSALSPRFEAVQEARVWDELFPRVKRLALIAARHDINFAIDAEEADRLVISLKLIERLAHDPALGDWSGLGVVVQAYQKRAPKVIEALKDLALSSGRRIMVRLVKGAYWDSEIKRAQVAGRPDYPVYTTKPATDVSYLVCAKALIDASPTLYPQFATHNAHSLAAVKALADQAGVTIELQRLHGMGEVLYDAAAAHYGPLRLRAYAPVGGHEELLPYLVRRLLENGANTSFVHQLLNEAVPPELVIGDPVAALAAAPARHPRIALPVHLYGPARANSAGRDFSIAATRLNAQQAAMALETDKLSPVPDTSTIQLDAAVKQARKIQIEWNQKGGAARGVILRATGDAIEENLDRLVALLCAEGGKTLNDGVAEVREAVDFCRYYASLAEDQFEQPVILTGPTGEVNTLSLAGRGVFACISPWNFPLAIFTGQIAAALAAGNAVIAKPAEQTPLIAREAVRLFHAAGLPKGLLTLAPGDGATIGAALVIHPGIDGIAFTGGTDTAWAINRAIAARPGPIIPLIAETGGLNGMFIDTTALKEQVVDDVILSAFGSAGQRCSALRLLFLPRESADGVIGGIAGAMDALVIGNPADPATDIGPVIDSAAARMLDAHVVRLTREAKILHRCTLGKDLGPGAFFAPTLAEIPDLDFLEQEIFGPILHILRYDPADLPKIARALAAKRYGLTLGIHSRIDSFAGQVMELVPAGNVYVNRSVIGAVVGVQPFGGEGLSGTGPKAGGPHALLRYATERAVSVNIAAKGGDPALLNL
jgi:RHH-type transcriptional regulator, proline utilization regulon repressor / proline dehydrogenase / delta 1-pyrroline-5-carboxylate dehydrogenase